MAIAAEEGSGPSRPIARPGAGPRLRRVAAWRAGVLQERNHTPRYSEERARGCSGRAAPRRGSRWRRSAGWTAFSARTRNLPARAGARPARRRPPSASADSRGARRGARAPTRVASRWSGSGGVERGATPGHGQPPRALAGVAAAPEAPSLPRRSPATRRGRGHLPPRPRPSEDRCGSPRSTSVYKLLRNRSPGVGGAMRPAAGEWRGAVRVPLSPAAARG